MKRQLHNKRGLTLMEAVIVVALLAVVAAIAVPVTIGSMAGVHARQCQSSRDALYTQWMLRLKLYGTADTRSNFKDFLAEAAARSPQSRDYIAPCPRGGTFAEECTDSVVTAITCTYHTGNNSSFIWPDLYVQYADNVRSLTVGGNSVTIGGVSISRVHDEGFVLEFPDGTKQSFKQSYLNNDIIYKVLLAAMGGSFPQGEIDGSVYDMMSYTSFGAPGVSVVAAIQSTPSSTHGGWRAYYIYYEGKWWKPLVGSHFNIATWTSATADMVAADMTAYFEPTNLHVEITGAGADFFA